MSSSSGGPYGDIGGEELGAGRNSGEPSQLEFRGRDAEECENFINAVSRQALAAGKQRDDQWSADFAASCFIGGALRWWDGLDERTQSSWRLLRKAMLSRYRPLFHGRSGEEAEEFVHMVQERALDVGKQQDSEWIAAFISSCFVGNALRWYSSLDPDVQDDWKRLRQAILTRFPQEDPGAASISTIPTPASASPPAPASAGPPAPASAGPPAPAPAGPPAPMMMGRRRGRFRVVCAAGSTIYYVSKKLGNAGYVILTAEPSESLHVEYSPSSNGRQALRIPDGLTCLKCSGTRHTAWQLSVGQAQITTEPQSADGRTGGSSDSHGKSHLCRLISVVPAVLFCLPEAVWSNCIVGRSVLGAAVGSIPPSQATTSYRFS